MGICMNTSSAPVQMDANLGWINAVQEMLIYVSSSIVKLLPAVPSKWRQGSVSDLRITTGKVSFSWDMEKKEFLRSEEHTSELQSRGHIVCRLLLEKKKT